MDTAQPNPPGSSGFDRSAAAARDAADPLASFRARFALPDGVIYLDGNSLGPLPAEAPAAVDDLVRRQWGDSLIRGWLDHGWMAMPERVGGKIAPLIGADADEVLVLDTTSLNLFKLLSAALDLRPGRRKLVSDTGNFPTDLYIAQGLLRRISDDYDLAVVDEGDVVSAIDADTAVVFLTEVNYRTGRRHDMAAVTEAAHAAGALVIWDLAHSCGALPIDLNVPFDLDGDQPGRGVADYAGADFAVGCGYKYLNGGPGAPAFLFVARRHQNRVQNVLAGWLGHEAPFDFDLDYRPAPGLRRMVCSTPSPLAVTPLETSLDVFAETDMQAIRAKSVALTSLFVDLVEERCAGHGLGLVGPRNPAVRGSQVSFAHTEGYAIMSALIDRGVIGDFRAPDMMRFGFTPLYTRYVDVFDAVEVLRKILDERAWDRPEYKVRAGVT